MNPFFSVEKPQRRFALFHEILPREESVFNAVLFFLVSITFA